MGEATTSTPSLFALMDGEPLGVLAHDCRPHTAVNAHPMMTYGSVYASLSRVRAGLRPSRRMAIGLMGARPEWGLVLEDWIGGRDGE